MSENDNQAMRKTAALVLKSEHCEETLELPAELWEKFERTAQEQEIAVEELFLMVLDCFIAITHRGGKCERQNNDSRINGAG